MLNCPIINFFPLSFLFSSLAALFHSVNIESRATKDYKKKRDEELNPIRLLWNKIMHDENERNYIHLFLDTEYI